jgi:hypothetical protein
MQGPFREQVRTVSMVLVLCSAWTFSIRIKFEKPFLFLELEFSKFMVLAFIS